MKRACPSAVNEALCGIQVNGEHEDLDGYPLDAAVTEDRFAILYFLGEQAQLLGQMPGPTFSYSIAVSY
jgi:hypothetical protein